MKRITIETKPFDGQKPGTSGLRKKVQVFQQPHYSENFIQSIFDALSGFEGQTLVIGGDGRFHNDTVIKTAIAMAAANGFGRIIVGKGGILSTPAASHLIRKHKAFGGIIFSASHNPGGPNGDFGIKYNIANGGPAPETVTDVIYERTKSIRKYRTIEGFEVDLSQIADISVGDTTLCIVDPVADYADLMETIFDFDAMRSAIKSGLSLRFDAMHAVTGPYAEEIFINRLGFPKESVINANPLPDFGGGHPDPNLVHAKALYDLMHTDNAPDIGAASDGDGDRNLIIGRDCFVNPSDAIAVLAANAKLIPYYANGLKGVARSMPTSAALDAVAKKLGLAIHETPTGWKFFGNLLDAGMISLCGEESAGAGSDHVREKDGLWAVLFWINILAKTGKSVKTILQEHWLQFGRNFYSRHDYENVDQQAASEMMSELKAKLPSLQGVRLGEHSITLADEFAYTDPVDGSHVANQGIRLGLDDGSRVIFRLSGTGTQGATIRIYLEKPLHESDHFQDDPQLVLADLISFSREISGLELKTGRNSPDVIT